MAMMNSEMSPRLRRPEAMTAAGAASTPGARPPAPAPRSTTPTPSPAPAAPAKQSVAPSTPAALAKPAPAKPTPSHPIDELLHKRIVVQSRNGAVIEGMLISRFENLLSLRDVTIRGSKHVAHTDRMLLVFGRENVSHLTSLPTTLTPIADVPRREP